MRIISGKARGTKIKTIENASTRPTLDRVKESLFNILQNKIKNSTVLDLFAGSGALGIEALSRGATKAIFCDSNNQAAKIIKQNIIKAHLEANSEVFNLDYLKCIKALSRRKEVFDIIFIDPPYELDLAVKATNEIVKAGLLKKNGTVVIETDQITRDENEINSILSLNENTLEKLKIFDKRKYGRASLLFLKFIE